MIWDRFLSRKYRIFVLALIQLRIRAAPLTTIVPSGLRPLLLFADKILFDSVPTNVMKD